MRLTVELLKDAPAYLNPLGQWMLELRGHRIPAIENLGAAGHHDAIDFTDNDIQALANFPRSPRITTLLFARNRISSIHPLTPVNVPNLTSLVLTGNDLTELADLDELGRFTQLTHLVVIENPVTKKEHYRYWILWRCRAVRFLDYQKVKLAERERAKELFGTRSKPTELAKKLMGKKSKAINISAEPTAGDEAAPTSKLARIKLTDTEKERLREMIKKATSLQEILRLEKELNEGRLPTAVHDADAMET